MNDATLLLYSGSISGAATTQQAAKFLGRNRVYHAVGRVGGDVTGAGATLTFTIEESSNGTSGWAAVPGSGTGTLVEMVGYVGGTTPRPEVPRVADPVRVPFLTTKDYVRVVTTAGGTTPAFPSTSIDAEPQDTATKKSGC